MHHFIINSSSRSGKGVRIWTEVKNELDRRHVEYLCYFTSYKEHASAIASNICKDNPGLKNIVVLGGDGTLNEVVNGIEDFSEIILGYIPTGSSNDLARSLRMSKDPLERLERILLPMHFDFLDVGSITLDNKETKRFVVSTGTGFDASVCEETFHSDIKSRLNKLGLGKLTYLFIALKQLFSSSFMEGEIIADNVSKSFHKMFLITSMVHRYEGGGLKLAPKANPRDGKLSVCIVHGMGRFHVLCLLPTLLLGWHTAFKGVETFDCKTMEIRLNAPSHVHTDGEYPGMYKDYKITCLPKLLRIIE